MSKASTAGLGEFATEFETLAETADDQAQQDAYEVWMAIARGEVPPQGAVRRVRRRAQEGNE